MVFKSTESRIAQIDVIEHEREGLIINKALELGARVQQLFCFNT